MKDIQWSEEKNRWLKENRGISFEDVENAILSGSLLDTTSHPHPKRYPNQRVFIITIRSYVFIVPFVEDEEKIFLKTCYPSRKATKHYSSKR
ncbi:DUF4258 domain-containing protein [Candidatus Woesebacteria bacterium]|nr:DUF4258 domain-containing protein [Candidatus Woesebacteria bacterium]